jgi:hypothetical protein
MGMSRSRYGRHTEKSITDYSINTSESLCSLLNELKRTPNGFNSFLAISDVILDFYRRALAFLKPTNCEKSSEEMEAADFNPFINSSTQNGMYQSLQSEKMSLPTCVIVLFCVLFEIPLPVKNNFINEMINDYSLFIDIVQKEKRYLKGNPLVTLLRIGLFIKVLRVLFKNNFESLKEDLYDKRITDLMRAEFTHIKDNNESHSQSSNDDSSLLLISNNSQTNSDFILNNNNNNNDDDDDNNNNSTITDDSHTNSFCRLFLILKETNLLLFKHMTIHEKNFFIFKKLF